MTRQISTWAALAAAFLAGPAVAQGDPMAMARAASANQLGVLEYCRDQGHTDAAAVAAMRSTAARLPPAPSTAATDAAEATGRQGSIVANGTTTTLASFADTTHTTVPALCKQLADGAMRSATAQAGGMGIGGMPAMPGGMPTMPGGMPAVPGGMPAMPSLNGVPPMPGISVTPR